MVSCKAGQHPAASYDTCVLQVFVGYLVAVILVQGNYGLKILEIQTKTSTDNDSGKSHLYMESMITFTRGQE